MFRFLWRLVRLALFSVLLFGLGRASAQDVPMCGFPRCEYDVAICNATVQGENTWECWCVDNGTRIERWLKKYPTDTPSRVSTYSYCSCPEGESGPSSPQGWDQDPDGSCYEGCRLRGRGVGAGVALGDGPMRWYQATEKTGEQCDASSSSAPAPADDPVCDMSVGICFDADGDKRYCADTETGRVCTSYPGPSCGTDSVSAICAGDPPPDPPDPPVEKSGDPPQPPPPDKETTAHETDGAGGGGDTRIRFWGGGSSGGGDDPGDGGGDDPGDGGGDDPGDGGGDDPGDGGGDDPGDGGGDDPGDGGGDDPGDGGDGGICNPGTDPGCDGGGDDPGDGGGDDPGDGGGDDPGDGGGDDPGDGDDGGECDPETDPFGCEGSGGLGDGPGDWYDATDKTFASIWADYQQRTENAPIKTAVEGFFTVGVGGGSCPVWTIPETAYTPAWDIDLHCREPMTTCWIAAGWLVLAVASYRAVQIAIDF